MAQPDKDILISRVVDDEATGEDWAALKELAERDPAVWRDLAEAQYTSIGLASAVQAAIEVADDVEAPVHEHIRARQRSRWGQQLDGALNFPAEREVEGDNPDRVAGRRRSGASADEDRAYGTVVVLRCRTRRG